MRAVLPLALAALLLAGCSTAPGPAAAAADPLAVAPGQEVPMVANVTLAPGVGLTLHLGTGWGQLRIRADEVTVDVENPRFDRFGPHADFGADRAYVPGAHTVVRLDGGDDAKDFWWLGYDSVFSGPYLGMRAATGGHLAEPAQDGVVVLTLANNVPGYTLQVQGGGAEANWTLGAHPGLVDALPGAKAVGGADAGAVRASDRRDWLQPLPGLGPSGIYARFWHTETAPAPEPTGTRAGVASGGFGVGPLGSQPFSYGPAPSFGFGSGFEGSNYAAVTVEPGDYQVAAWFEATDAGTTTSSDGLAVLAVPLTAPAAPATAPAS